jgi:tetratricopeptide (TPR) repeat protein
MMLIVSYATVDMTLPRKRKLPSSLCRYLLPMLFVVLPPVAHAEGQDAATYDKCLALARKDPSEGFETGSVWRDHGGGLPARHCVAVALIGLKEYVEAAHRLEKIAAEMVRESDALRAGVLAQAAEAWSEAGQSENAEAALTAALKLAPRNPDYLVNRAVTYAQRKNYHAAVDDLNKALTAGPRADALAYRASAWRFLGDLKQARFDAEKAVQSDPTLAEAWLELGNIKRLSDDATGARQDWLHVIALSPDSAAADAARDNIETLDVHVEGGTPSR